MNETDLDQETPTWVYWQNAVEFFVSILSLISAINVFIIFTKQWLFHTNLLLLMLNLYIGYLLLVFTRVVLCAASFQYDELLCKV